MSHARATLAAFGASLVAFAGPTYATDDPLDQIIVTGSRAPLAISASGSTVTIIERDTIERRQARYVTDLLRQVPGFAVSQSGVPGAQTQVRVRGAEANHVLVLIDGARANDPATGDEFRWEFLTTSNIERIEIVRGPQSAIWGSDALAGVINIITRSGAGATSVDAYVETGTHATLNNGLNGNFGGGNWDVGISVERVATDGGNISRTGSEDDPSRVTTAALNTAWQATDALAFRLAARSVDARSQYDNVDYFVTGLPADSDVELDTTQRYAQLAVTAGGDAAPVRHRLSTHYLDSENRNRTSGVDDISALSDRLTLGYQADLRVGTNTLSLALEHQKTNFEQSGPVGFGDPNQVRSMSVDSFIADYQGKFGDAVSWLASARYDDNSAFEDAVTGRLSIAWQATEQTVVRLSGGTGRKNPTFIELYGYFPGQFANNPNLRPEKSRAVDVGVEQQLSSRLNLQFTAFRQDLEDEINGFVFDPTTFLSTADNMQGKSRRDGVEIALRWDAGQDLTAGASYTYTNSRADDVREVRRPKHSGSLDLDLAFLDERGHVVLAAAYGGTRIDTFFPPWPNPPEIVTLDAHWLADLTVRYQASPTIDLFARIANLLDTDYEQVYGYQMPGRTVYAGVTARFAR
jgi:vitamin B12 transporter